MLKYYFQVTPFFLISPPPSLSSSSRFSLSSSSTGNTWTHFSASRIPSRPPSSPSLEWTILIWFSKPTLCIYRSDLSLRLPRWLASFSTYDALMSTWFYFILLLSSSLSSRSQVQAPPHRWSTSYIPSLYSFLSSPSVPSHFISYIYLHSISVYKQPPHAIPFFYYSEKGPSSAAALALLYVESLARAVCLLYYCYLLYYLHFVCRRAVCPPLSCITQNVVAVAMICLYTRTCMHTLLLDICSLNLLGYRFFGWCELMQSRLVRQFCFSGWLSVAFPNKHQNKYLPHMVYTKLPDILRGPHRSTRSEIPLQ